MRGEGRCLMGLRGGEGRCMVGLRGGEGRCMMGLKGGERGGKGRGGEVHDERGGEVLDGVEGRGRGVHDGAEGRGEIHDRERWKWRRGLWDGQLCCSLSADFSLHVAT